MACGQRLRRSPGLGGFSLQQAARVYTRALLAATTFHLIGEIPLDKCSLDSLEERAQHETSNELSGLVHPKPCVFDSPFFIKSYYVKGGATI